MNRAQQLLLLAVRIYQRLISPMLGGLLGPNGCRFEPSCSHYAAQAVTEHGAMRGTLLATRRLCRCHPWGGCGIDPVPRKAEAGEKYLEAKFPALTS